MFGVDFFPNKTQNLYIRKIRKMTKKSMVENVKYALNVAHHSPSRSRKLQHLVN